MELQRKLFSLSSNSRLIVRNFGVKNGLKYGSLYVNRSFSYSSVSKGGEPPLFSKLKEDLKKAMRERLNTEKLVIRDIMNSVKQKNIDKANSVTTDIDLYEVLQNMISQRKNSSEEYNKSGRKDLAEKEEEELNILNKYSKLIPVKTEDEILNEILNAAKELNLHATGLKDTGKIGKEISTYLESKNIQFSKSSFMKLISSLIKDGKLN